MLSVGLHTETGMMGRPARVRRCTDKPGGPSRASRCPDQHPWERDAGCISLFIISYTQKVKPIKDYYTMVWVNTRF